MGEKRLVEVLSEKTSLAKSVVENVINEMNSIITDFLKTGDVVNIAGFGTFFLSKRKSKVGRSPKTGEFLEIPKKNVTKFKSEKELKNEINN